METFEETKVRTGRKWPYRTEDWPCPACGEASCDLDIDMERPRKYGGMWHFIYYHVDSNGERVQ